MTDLTQTDRLPLTGRTALVTGSTSGIGAAAATALARDPDQSIITISENDME